MMCRNSSCLLFICLSLLLLTCQEEKVTPREYPRLTTLEVTDISTNGAVFTAEVIYPGDAAITDHGFVWKEENTPALGYAEQKSLGRFEGTGTFSADISATLQKDKVYKVSAYAIAGDYVVYGKVVTFVSQGSESPEIFGFQPEVGSWGDTIRISGKNFSRITSNVYFGGQESLLLEATDSTIISIVPDSISQGDPVEIVVSSAGMHTTANKKFEFLNPEISDFTPKEGTWSNVITIFGSHFLQNSEVYFGDIKGKIISYSDKELKVEVPDNLYEVESQLKIIANASEVVIEDKFKLLPPEFINVDLNKGYVNTLLTITGNNFHVLRDSNQVYFNDVKAEVVSATPQELRVTVPNESYYTRDVTIQVSTIGQFAGNSEIFHISGVWFKKKVHNEELLKITKWDGVSINGNGYLVQDKIDRNQPYPLMYNEQTNSYQEISPFPGYGSYTIINSFGAGGNLFTMTEGGVTKYNPNVNTWSALMENPIIKLYRSFVIGNEAFLLYTSGGLKIFDAETLKFTDKNRFPYATNAISFSINGKGYYGDADTLWMYDQTNDKWLNKSPVPEVDYWSKTIVLNGSVYLINQFDNVYQYNSADDSWTKLELNQSHYGESWSWPAVFHINDLGYALVSAQLWEFNPNEL